MKSIFLIISLLSSGLAIGASKNNPYLDARCAMNKHQYELAYNILKPLSEKNDVSGMKMMAQLMKKSYGGNPYYDPEKSLFWGNKAAESGDPYAQFLLGLIIRDFWDKDIIKLETETKMSFDEISTIGRKRVGLAIKWYRLAAEQGHAYAQMQLGDYNNGGLYIPLNQERAYMWFTLANRRSSSVQDQGYNGLYFAKRRLYDMDHSEYFSAENRKKAIKMADQWEKDHPNAAKTWLHFTDRPGELPHEEMTKRDCYLK